MSRPGICHIWFRGRHISPSMPYREARSVAESKYGMDCGLELNAKVFQLRLNNVSGVLVLEGYDYSGHIISRQSSRSLQWLLVSISRVDKGIDGGVDKVVRVVQT